MKRIFYAIASLMLIACGTSRTAADQIKGEWSIEDAMGVSTENGEKPAFINFASNGKLNGDASVNTFFGSYKYDGSSLKLNNIGMTRMMGASMEIEDAITEAINTTATIEIEGDNAVIRNSSGAPVMTLKRK